TALNTVPRGLMTRTMTGNARTHIAEAAPKDKAYRAAVLILIFAPPCIYLPVRLLDRPSMGLLPGRPFPPEATSLSVRWVPRPLPRCRGGSEAREPASTRPVGEGAGSGNPEAA